MSKLRWTTRVINESMRLYPQPPVLIRRAAVDTKLVRMDGVFPVKFGKMKIQGSVLKERSPERCHGVFQNTPCSCGWLSRIFFSLFFSSFFFLVVYLFFFFFFFFFFSLVRERKKTTAENTDSFVLSLFYPTPPPQKKKNPQGGFAIPAGSDLFLSVWNLHRDPGRWKDADDFIPERFGPVDDVVAGSEAARCPRSGSPPSAAAASAAASSSSYVVPNEITESFSYLPFGGGKRKCIGDQFALFESVTALAIFARRVSFVFFSILESSKGTI